jgi:SAM-dependent methyltransferase
VKEPIPLLFLGDNINTFSMQFFKIIFHMSNKFSLLLTFKRFIQPTKFKYIRKFFDINKSLKVLDVGCGYGSETLTRRWLKVNTYHGIDKQIYNGDVESYRNIDKFFLLDLEVDSFEEIPDAYYDLIIVSHVIEHIINAQTVLHNLSAKLSIGGVMYIETPSEYTLRYPSAIGFLSFYDDPTHVKHYSKSEIDIVLVGSYLRLRKSQIRRDYFRIVFLSPVAIMLNLIYFLPVKRKICSYGLWDLLGVARIWIAQK